MEMDYFDYVYQLYTYAIMYDKEAHVSYIEPTYRNTLRELGLYPVNVGLDYVSMDEVKEILELEVKRRNAMEDVVRRLAARLADAIDKETFNEILANTFNEELLEAAKNATEVAKEPEAQTIKKDYSIKKI